MNEKSALIVEGIRNIGSAIYGSVVALTLTDLIKKEQWFAGIIISASYIDLVGKMRLHWTYEGKISKDKIDHLTLDETIMFLIASKIIDDKTYTKKRYILQHITDYSTHGL